MPNVGQELLNVPFPEMVESMGMSIARAQYALDMNSVKMAQIMSGSDWLEEDEEGNEVVRPGMKVSFGGRQLSLLELGFTPTFYQFVDTIIEVKISVSMQSETNQSNSSSNTNINARVSRGWSSVSASMSISTVSASFSARNSFSASGASLIRTKLVPLPPPSVLQERVRALMEEGKKKEMSFDQVVLEIAVVGAASSAPRYVVSDTEMAPPAAVPGFTLTLESANGADKKSLKVVAGSDAKAGVSTINLVGDGATNAGKKGIIKVLVTKS